MRDFLTGVSYLPRGFRHLWEPRLRRFVVIPIAINVVVFALLFWGAGVGFNELLQWLLPDPGTIVGTGWWADTKRFLAGAAYWLLWPLFLIAVTMLMFYSFTLVANLLGSPFNSVLAARVEEMASGQAPPPQDAPLMKEIAGSIGGELRKYVYFLKLAIPLWILMLIPGVNLIAGPLWALFAAWALALEYLDYPMGNHGLRFVQTREELRRRRGMAIGLGFGVLAMTLIPVLNLLAMPTGVIAASLLWSERLREKTGYITAGRAST